MKVCFVIGQKVEAGKAYPYIELYNVYMVNAVIFLTSNTFWRGIMINVTTSTCWEGFYSGRRKMEPLNGNIICLDDLKRYAALKYLK